MTQPIKYHYGMFPPPELDWSRLISYIGPANAALARYDGTLSVIPNQNLLLAPLTTQEAVLSSRIEGTEATMGEVLEYEADKKDISPKKEEDINEVLNYRKAMCHAVELLKELPLSQRVVKGAHRILLDGVRGHNKLPGEYRRTQNWIGSPGCTIDDARYVPVDLDKLNDGMSEWEKFIHTDVPDRLVQLAILHAEFESLHPFCDGNGRLGRMFIPLFLCKSGLIQSPMFYMSSFLESNRDEYYTRLLNVSQHNDWEGWCIFFLKGIQIQAEENQKRAMAILALYENKKQEIIDLLHSQYSVQALDFLFERPIFNSTTFICGGFIPDPSAKKILVKLRNSNIVKTIRKSSGSRPALYAFAELLNAAEGREVF